MVHRGNTAVGVTQFIKINILAYSMWNPILNWTLTGGYWANGNLSKMRDRDNENTFLNLTHGAINLKKIQV